MTRGARPRRAIAALVAALALVPAVARADQGGGHGHDQGAGHGKRAAEPVAVPPTAAAVVAPAAPAPAVEAEAADANSGHGKALGHTKGRKAAEAAVAQPAEAEPAAVAPEPEASPPQPAPAPTPVVAPPAPAVALPPAPALPVARPAPPSRWPRVKQRPQRAVRVSPPSRAVVGPAASPASVVPRPALPQQHPLPSRRPQPSRPHVTRHAAAGDPVTRTVTRVLALIPLELRLALGALIVLGLALGSAAALQTLRSRRLEHARRALVADVGVLQSALLPTLAARVGEARVSAAYRPADGLAAGGDFFDVFALPGQRTALIVGDVAGHGRGVVPLTAAVRYGLRAYLEAGLSPRAVLHVASNALAPQLGGTQVTAAVAILEPRGRLTYACAGHWPPLLTGVSAAAVTKSSSPPLGAGLPTGRRQTTVTLAHGAAACFFTDGLLDAVGRDGARLGPARLRGIFDGLGPSPSADGLLAAVVAQSSRQPDDMAACVLAPLAWADTGGGERVEELEVDAAALADGRLERFLEACAARPVQRERAIAEAGRIARGTGTAVVEVRIAGGDGAATVGVRRPAAVALRLPGWPAAAARVA